MKTFGGFLPFEELTGNEYHDYSSDQKQYYNSGKTAVYYCIQQLGIKRLFLPRFFCPSTKAYIERSGVQVSYYHVRKDLTIELPVSEIGDEDAALIVNYYGLCRRNIDEYKDSGMKLIIDNCQAFYEEPVFKDNVLNFYAYKKFFGVPDGAFVLGWKLEAYDLPCHPGLDIADYLIGSRTSGTGPWYQRKKEVDEIIASDRLSASALTRQLVKAIDYERIRDARRNNYRILDEAFGNDNLLKLTMDDKAVPYLYPLNIGKDIKKELVSKGVFVPTLWEDTLDKAYEGTDEYFLSKYTLNLPVDQRYDEEDMHSIISIIRELI
ncbi:hypothetical protein [Butyrivibrio sp. MC2013]|uniref:hypothetical protein n=1 Tax=Butyrivibrio sp. MC2013 TaxID=1280686 RepID=UPI00040258E1|nr:hypothetical protein [Butyrivibrio sp. MC2013]